MTTYQITTSAGVDLGAYQGATADEAIEAMHRDAGYASSELVAEALGATIDSLRAELTVREVAAEDA